MKFAHIRSVTLRCLASDMTMSRWTMAIASLACACELLAPWDTLGRHGLELLHQIMPNDWVYGLLFLAHGLGMLWRIYDPKARPRWSLVVNVLGFVLFFSLGILVDLSLGHFTLQSGMTLAISWVSFWAIVRSGNGADAVGA